MENGKKLYCWQLLDENNKIINYGATDNEYFCLDNLPLGDYYGDSHPFVEIQDYINKYSIVKYEFIYKTYKLHKDLMITNTQTVAKL